MLPKTIRLGMVNDDVRLCQERLNYFGAMLKVDGNFGPLTERAVWLFQKACMLKADGVVGLNTWGCLLTDGRVVSVRNSYGEEMPYGRLLSLVDIVPFYPPTLPGPSPVGKNGEIFRSNGKVHGALDIIVPIGTSIYCIEMGDISNMTMRSKTAGISVTIRGGWTGLHYTYCHFERFSEALAAMYDSGAYKGKTVEAGEIIGIVGMTGNTTGPHLHFSMSNYVLPLREWVDPRDVLPENFFTPKGS